MGRTPAIRSLFLIHLGEGPIFTFFTTLATYLGQRVGFSIVTFTKSSALPSAFSATLISG